MPAWRKCAAIAAAALRPRSDSGRSWSATPGASQLDLAWRSRCKVGNGSTLSVEAGRDHERAVQRPVHRTFVGDLRQLCPLPGVERTLHGDPPLDAVDHAAPGLAPGAILGVAAVVAPPGLQERNTRGSGKRVADRVT